MVHWLLLLVLLAAHKLCGLSLNPFFRSVDVKRKYEITVDWTGTLHDDISLDLYYANRTIRVSMPGFIKKVPIKYSHPTPTIKQHAPRQPEPIIC